MKRTRVKPVYLDTIVYQSRKGPKKSRKAAVQKEQPFSSQNIISGSNVKRNLYITFSVTLSISMLSTIHIVSSYMKDLVPFRPESDLVMKCESFPFQNSEIHIFTRINASIWKKNGRYESFFCIVNATSLAGKYLEGLQHFVCSRTAAGDRNDSARKEMRCCVVLLMEISMQPISHTQNCTEGTLFTYPQNPRKTNLNKYYHHFLCHSTEHGNFDTRTVCEFLDSNESAASFLHFQASYLTKVEDYMEKQRRMHCINISVLTLVIFALATLALYLGSQFFRESLNQCDVMQKICDATHFNRAEINQEKSQTQDLLYQMLPHSVADKLISGQQVEAETFEEVTIYFSDIVGFNDVALSATPIQIVNLLNSIYG